MFAVAAAVCWPVLVHDRPIADSDHIGNGEPAGFMVQLRPPPVGTRRTEQRKFRPACRSSDVCSTLWC
jgi:hypothetical protein